MKVALYARVSTADKDQDPETQLHALRLETQRRSWVPAGEYVDHASALDYRGRTAWRDLLAKARTGGVDAIAVLRLDRAFRSALDALQTIGELEERQVGLITVAQPVDTTTAMGKAMLTIMAAFAELERAIIAERVREGLDRARAQGKRLGRPPGAKDNPKKARKKSGYFNRYRYRAS